MPTPTPTPAPTPAPAPTPPAWVTTLESFVFNQLLGSISGAKTYLSAAGLIGLAVYQISIGSFDLSVQSFLAALAAAGLRHAISKTAN